MQQVKKHLRGLKWRCPRCLAEVTDFPAISRRDNKTKICSNCGREEALFDFKIFKLKEAEMKWMERIK